MDMDFPEAHYIIGKLNEEFDEVQNENLLSKNLKSKRNINNGLYS